jgi:hypothetical protein
MNANQPDWLALVREKVETLRYGVVQIVVHDSRVTQIERTEKTKIDRGESYLPPVRNDFRRPDTLEEP